MQTTNCRIKLNVQKLVARVSSNNCTWGWMGSVKLQSNTSEFEWTSLNVNSILSLSVYGSPTDTATIPAVLRVH